MSARPILMLELNEAHWPVLDLASTRHPKLREFVSRARTWTTLAPDGTTLSPWVTWPTLHRGISPREHGITHLGQDPSTYGGTPIWEEVRRRGGTIGLVGTLASWPPRDPGPGGFHVPEIFAPSAASVPAILEPLQAMSIALARESGRVASTRIPMRGALRALPGLLRLGLSPRLALHAGRQLLGERLDAQRRDGRGAVQAELFWDVFRRLYARAPRAPTFASFFTNHVASVLHRHWDAAFPQDFVPSRTPRRVPRALVDRALYLLARIVEEATHLARGRTLVVLASSMGQGAVHRRTHHGRELAVIDLCRLLALVGIPPEAHNPGLAMVPQVTTRVPDPVVRARIRDELHALRTVSGHRFLDVKSVGESVSITIGTPSGPDVDAGVWIDRRGARVPFAQGGIATHEVPAGTAHHVREGALAIVGEGVSPDATRTTVPLEDVKSLLLALSADA